MLFEEDNWYYRDYLHKDYWNLASWLSTAIQKFEMLNSKKGDKNITGRRRLELSSERTILSLSS